MTTLCRILRALFPGIADGLVPALLASLNPGAKPGALLDWERSLDGEDVRPRMGILVSSGESKCRALCCPQCGRVLPRIPFLNFTKCPTCRKIYEMVPLRKDRP